MFMILSESNLTKPWLHPVSQSMCKIRLHFLKPPSNKPKKHRSRGRRSDGIMADMHMKYQKKLKPDILKF